jgi:hypothetical protein
MWFLAYHMELATPPRPARIEPPAEATGKPAPTAREPAAAEPSRP